MSHLLAELIRQAGHPATLLLVAVSILGGLGLSVPLRSERPRGQRARSVPGEASVFAGVMLAVSWVVFRIAFSESFPQLPFAIPAGSVLLASVLLLATSVVAVTMQRSRGHLARNAMLAGSFMACGLSCLMFTSMAGLVRPYALAYDLPSVLVTMMLGAALCACGFRQGANTAGRHRSLVCAAIFGVALAELVMGSLASILPFAGWMAASNQPDSLASSPVAVIVASEAMAVLGFGLFGSLVDNRLAARDRADAARVRQLADSALEGLVIHDNGRILDGNVSFAALAGLSLDKLSRHEITRLLPSERDITLWSPNAGGELSETDIVTQDGTRIPVEILSRPIHYGGRSATVTALRDLRERRASEKRIRFLAHHDTLTELPNRALLNETLDDQLRASTRRRMPIAVFCLDLDGFKAVNDTLGHAGGDTLLRLVSKRIRASIREDDFLARVGGDEFVILQTVDAGMDRATTTARDVIAELLECFEIDGHRVNVGVSIGIALHPQDGDTASALLKQADTALYRAKELGRGVFCFFEAGMDMAQRKRRELERDLRQAIRNETLVLHFQPLFNSRRELVTFEALLRWTHPTLGQVSPVEFIPLAEETGMIVQLGEWVLRTACHTAMSWENQCRVAVNLSPAQFLRSNIPEVVAGILAETGLPASRLELELTEGVLIGNAEEALRQLVPLRDMGVKLVLDDFGTGYSSLSYLHRFPFDKLKVDRSFIRNLETDRGARAIVNAIISMSRNLDLEVTAEGVETVEQFELLRAQGCHELQGFLLGRPMPDHEAVILQKRCTLEEQENAVVAAEPAMVVPIADGALAAV